MKKRTKIFAIVSIISIIILSCTFAAIPRYQSYDNIKNNLVISEENNHLYIGISHHASEVNHLASRGGHIYLYSLADGSRCYAQYIYAKASWLDTFNSNGTSLYYYPLCEFGAEHGTAINVKSDGNQEEYACYTVAVYYQDKDGGIHLIWELDS